MSLAIEAGSKAVFVTADENAEPGAGEAFVYDAGFPERLDGLPQGIYRFTGATFSFDVGGAQDYFIFLEQLSIVALGTPLQVMRNDPTSYANSAFFELLNFSDNEGAIGPSTSGKLARDFLSYKARFEDAAPSTRSLPSQPRTLNFSQQLMKLLGAKQHAPSQDPNRLIELYEDFHQAFELASDEGFVVFL
ncbi:MAG TPA: hypothetical protein VKY74_10770 [Chloroflexia bacterium]|nr:hypothetical protein [Chloroflexia bacterium]